MKTITLMMMALTLPLAAQPLPPDRPADAANPAASRYVAVPGFLKLPPRARHGFLQRGVRRQPWQCLGGGSLRHQ